MARWQLSQSTVNLFSAETRLFLFTGLLGGFTTFSAFGYEGVFLVRRGEIAVAATYAVLSVICGFAAVWLGFKLLSFVTVDRRVKSSPSPAKRVVHPSIIL